MSLFDPRHVRRAFSRSAGRYDDAAGLQRRIGDRLLETLDYLADPGLARPPPTRVLDIGCGTGHFTQALQRRWPKAQVVGIDIALPMLQRMLARDAGLAARLGWKRLPAAVCADAAALPLADGAFDLVFSNLCLQWLDDLPGVFAGWRRVLAPDGALVCSTFGPDTLWELREAFAQADDAPHVSPFADIAHVGDALVAAGFRQPVLDRDHDVETHASLAGLMAGLRAIGATNALQARRHALTGRRRFAAAEAAYPRDGEGRLPATWESISMLAFAPPAGATVREGDAAVARVPLATIPVRRRGA